MKFTESETLELKPSLSQINEIIETVAAFANNKGGKVLVGISDKGEVLGVKIGKDTLERLVNSIKQNTEPSIFPLVRQAEIKNKSILEIIVKESKEKPVLAFGRAFRRVGKSSLRVDKAEHERMVLEKKKVYFDSLACENATFDDIDAHKIVVFLQRSKKERNSDIDPSVSAKDALLRLGLLVHNKLTNAAVLLFGKNPQEFFLNAEVRCARFKGIEPIDFIDMKVFGADIISQRDDALEFVKEHIQLQAKIVGIERIETWEYPLEAIREAITNALCHRDYEIASNVQIRIFEDRLEIWSPGSLPSGLTLEKLRKKHFSVLRNPLLGKCFFLIKYIEQWGTGVNRMIQACISHKLPEPDFEDIGNCIVVTFRKYRINDEIISTLNQRQRNVMDYILEKKEITNQKYREINQNITDRTALNDLNNLVSKGILITKGKKKNRIYVLR